MLLKDRPTGRLLIPLQKLYKQTKTNPREEQVRSVPAKKSFSSLILPPTARSRQQSRGLHPVGALSVPPLEWYPLGTVRPTRVTAKQQKRHVPGVKKFRVISYSM